MLAIKNQIFLKLKMLQPISKYTEVINYISNLLFAFVLRE